MFKQLKIHYLPIKKFHLKKKQEQIIIFEFVIFFVCPRWEKFNNLSISYLCPKQNNKWELEFNDKAQCTNELQVTTTSSGDYCGEPGEDDSRDYHYIGYGLVKQSCIFSCTVNPLLKY